MQDVKLNLCGCSKELLIFVRDQGGTRDGTVLQHGACSSAVIRACGIYKHTLAH